MSRHAEAALEELHARYARRLLRRTEPGFPLHQRRQIRVALGSLRSEGPLEDLVLREREDGAANEK